MFIEDQLIHCSFVQFHKVIAPLCCRVVVDASCHIKLKLMFKGIMSLLTT